MATKTIDVTLATIRNVGPRNVAPKGALSAEIVRSINDDEVFQAETLYSRDDGQPMHPSGALLLPPGKSLTYNITKRLTVSHFEQETEGHVNQMLIFDEHLTEDVLDSVLHVHPDEKYQGSYRRQVSFDEIDGFKAVSCDYRVLLGGEEVAKIIVGYTVSLVDSSG
ncbi:hypothetical protein [Streptomyces sp. NPDC004284]|uniref:hypothetical protein n=1 Tax=Streptomyces sp. NPDC004284 TaxID=3364695 RepID=UPI00367792AB